MKSELFDREKQKSQVEVDKYVLDFLGEMKVETQDDLIKLLKHIHNSIEFREYNEETREHADSIQWKRTASEIIQDGYVYRGKACSDLALVFLTVCKALGIDGRLVKLIRVDGKSSHTITEIKLKDGWHRFDVSNKGCIPVKGQLKEDQVWNEKWQGGWKVWKRGSDLWELGLDGIDKEEIVND
jgi:hypothetical protein